MSDYELLNTLHNAFMGWITLLTSYISIVFAFVVAGYLAAHRLTRTLAMTAVGLFTVASVFFILMTVVVSLDVTRLAAAINESVHDGTSSLTWVGFVSPDGRTPPPIATMLSYGIMGLSYAGAVFFFLSQRRSLATTSTAAAIPGS